MIVKASLPETPTAAVLIIGNEILSGRTQDVNLGWIGGRLVTLGIRLCEARVIADIESDIVDAVRALSARYTYVFTTGGIGPTHDDITADSMAKAFDVPIAQHPEAVRRLSQRYGGDDQLTPGRLRMARIPVGAALVDNPVSGAPGFRIANVFVFAGVPDVMRGMFDTIAGSLAGGPPILHRIVTCQIPESVLAEPLAAIQARFADVEIGSYPFFRHGGFGVSLIARGVRPDTLDRVVAELAEMIRDLGGEIMDNA